MKRWNEIFKNPLNIFNGIATIIFFLFVYLEWNNCQVPVTIPNFYSYSSFHLIWSLFFTFILEILAFMNFGIIFQIFMVINMLLSSTIRYMLYRRFLMKENTKILMYSIGSIISHYSVIFLSITLIVYNFTDEELKYKLNEKRNMRQTISSLKILALEFLLFYCLQVVRIDNEMKYLTLKDEQMQLFLVFVVYILIESFTILFENIIHDNGLFKYNFIFIVIFYSTLVCRNILEKIFSLEMYFKINNTQVIKDLLFCISILVMLSQILLKFLSIKREKIVNRTSQSNKLSNNIKEKLNFKPINYIHKPYMVGFPNLDLSCYIGSALRSLFSIPPFISFIEKSYEELTKLYENLQTNNPLIYSSFHVIEGIKKGKCDLSNYMAICNLILINTTQNNLSQEGNAKDIIDGFIITLEKNILNMVSKADVSNDPSFINKAKHIWTNFNNLFDGKISKRCKCPTCGNIWTHETKNAIINFFNSNETDVNDIGSCNKTIESVLEKYFSNQILNRRTIEKFCTQCQVDKGYIIEETIIYSPQILILHLNRSIYSKITNCCIKDNRPVTYSTNEIVINVHFSISEKKIKEKTYIFSSVVSHYCVNLTTWHYKSLGKVIINDQDIPKFVEFNDSIVTEVTDVKEVNEKYTESICEKYPCDLLFYYLKN